MMMVADCFCVPLRVADHLSGSGGLRAGHDAYKRRDWLRIGSDWLRLAPHAKQAPGADYRASYRLSDSAWRADRRVCSRVRVP